MNGFVADVAGYRLEQLVLTDTVSATYHAISEKHPTQRGPVALRITEPRDTAGGPDADTVAAFFDALDGAVAVDHRGLATIHDAGEAAGRLYVATDLVAGTTLDEHIQRYGPLSAGDAVALLWPIAEGLDHAHAAGVVHGAISPRTILVPQRGTDPATCGAILTGFGLDTLLARQVRADRSRVDVTDLCYVAPEQLWGGDTDARVDQYALACALYHCVAGRRPFVRPTVAAMFGAHLFSEARVPASHDGDRTLGPAVAVGMAKRPNERHGSCVALMRATGHVPAAPAVRAPVAPAAATTPAASDATAPPAATAAPEARAPVGPAAAARVGRRRATRRRKRWFRLPIAWHVAVMLVLAGVISTLLFAAVLNADEPVDTGSTAPVRAPR
jgi:serine/threonine-protein kinase